jgi:dUTP pyrophosphatase
MIQLKVKKLRPEAVLPTKGTSEAAGWDLYAAEDHEMRCGDLYKCPTGLSMAIPKGYEGQVRSRSGLVAKTGVHVANQPGTIDSDYRGEICVLLKMPSVSNEISRALTPHFYIKKGDRIAQLVIAKVPEVEILEVSDLDATDRGEGGFGSTGVR